MVKGRLTRVVPSLGGEVFSLLVSILSFAVHISRSHDRNKLNFSKFQSNVYVLRQFFLSLSIVLGELGKRELGTGKTKGMVEVLRSTTVPTVGVLRSCLFPEFQAYYSQNTH